VADVLVNDAVFPLRLMPKQGGSTKDFEDFVDRFDPRSEVDGTYQVKAILDHRWVQGARTKGGKQRKVLEFLVHWKGYGRKDSTWEPHSHLTDAAEVVDKYKGKYGVVNYAKQLNEELMAVVELMHRHRLKCDLQTALKAYSLEFDTVNGLRMQEVFGADKEAVLRNNEVPRLRMNPEPKVDRLKMRLLVRGDTEPRHLFEGASVDSPTPMPSSMRLMLALEDEDDGSGEPEEIAIGDVGTAFLKGDGYGPSDKPRWVAYKAHKKAALRVFRLTGPLYGQVDAPIRWHKSVVKWMVAEKGFVQSKNDVCMFRHPETRLKVLIHVDDNMSRGTRRHTQEFWSSLNEKFGLKSWAFVETGEQHRFLGSNVFKDMMDGKVVFGVHQNDDMDAFLDEYLPEGERPVTSPMTDKHEMYSNQVLLGCEDSRKFRSILMKMSWMAQQTRLDIVTPVNVLAQVSSAPTVSAWKALVRVMRYLDSRRAFTLYAVRAGSLGQNKWSFWVDSDLAGDPMHTRSRTGAVTVLNGMAVAWRSNKQPMTCFSSGAAEVFAFSEAVRDARLLVWRAEELGAEFKYPIEMKEDNAAAVSFQGSTTPSSKLRGVYNFRDKWVQELKNEKIVRAVKTPTDENAADLLTKCHQSRRRRKLLSLLNCEAEPSLAFRGH
jgi:hypothetical protein